MIQKKVKSEVFDNFIELQDIKDALRVSDDADDLLFLALLRSAFSFLDDDDVLSRFFLAALRLVSLSSIWPEMATRFCRSRAAARKWLLTLTAASLRFPTA